MKKQHLLHNMWVSSVRVNEYSHSSAFTVKELEVTDLRRQITELRWSQVEGLQSLDMEMVLIPSLSCVFLNPSELTLHRQGTQQGPSTYPRTPSPTESMTVGSDRGRDTPQVQGILQKPELVKTNFELVPCPNPPECSLVPAFKATTKDFMTGISSVSLAEFRELLDN